MAGRVSAPLLFWAARVGRFPVSEPQGKLEGSAMVDFVIQASAHDQPPEARPTQDLRFLDFPREVLFGHFRDPPRARLPESRQLLRQRRPIVRVGVSRRDDGPRSGRPGEVLEDPDVRIDEVLDDIDEGERSRRRPPFFISGADLTNPLEGRFPDGIRKKREAPNGRRGPVKCRRIDWRSLNEDTPSEAAESVHTLRAPHRPRLPLEKGETNAQRLS